MAVADSVALEHPGILLPNSFVVWDKTGAVVLRTRSRDAVFRDRVGRYFRDNATGNTFRIISRFKTELVPRSVIHYRRTLHIGH